MKLENVLKRKSYVKVDLTKINTNHFEVKATINNAKGRFILDTGASNSCVSLELAEKFQLDLEDSETKAAGAGATGMETKISSKNEINLGKWNYKNFHLVLLDLSHVNLALTEHNAEPVDGIIGADILEKGEAIIDYKNQCVYLKKIVFKY